MVIRYRIRTFHRLCLNLFIHLPLIWICLIKKSIPIKVRWENSPHNYVLFWISDQNDNHAFNDEYERLCKSNDSYWDSRRLCNVIEYKKIQKC